MFLMLFPENRPAFAYLLNIIDFLIIIFPENPLAFAYLLNIIDFFNN
jgi:hypothetical protein